jgi:hypothetical protein
MIKTMRKTDAAEKLRVIDILKENATMVIAIGGFVWMIYSFVLLPLKNMEFQMSDVLNNHLKTIQDEQIAASTERKEQRELLNIMNENLVRLQEQVKLLK